MDHRGGAPNYFIMGDANAMCDRCDRKYKRSQLMPETDLQGRGLFVCARCFDGPHPRDFTRGVPDVQTFRNPRPRKPQIFIDSTDTTAEDL